MNKAAGRPWPVICPEDDVLDFMVMEAVAIKAMREDAEAQKKQERDSFKKDYGELDKFR